MVSFSLSRPPTLWVAVAKGSVATTVVIALTLIRVFDQLLEHPLALNGVSLISELGLLARRPSALRSS